VSRTHRRPDRAAPRCLPGHYQAWAVAPLLIAITVLGRSSQNVSQTTYPLVGHELLAMTNATIGLVGAAAGVTGIAASALVVPRIPVQARLWMLAAGQALGAIAFIFFAASRGQAELWAGAVILGAAGGIVFPLLMTVIGQGRRGDRAKALAVFALALSASLVVGPLLEAGVLHLLDDSLRAAFAALLPLPVAATVFAVSAALRSRPDDIIDVDQVGSIRPRQDTALAERQAIRPWTKQRALPARGAPAASAQERSGAHQEGATAHATQKGEDPEPSWGAEDASLSKHAFRIALLALLTYQAPFVALLTFGGLLGHHDDHASATSVELAFGVFFTFSLGVRILVTIRSPIRHTGRVLTGSVIATIVGVAVIGAAHGLVAFYVGMAILGAPHGVTLPVASSILAENTSTWSLGRANGRLMAGTNVLTVAVPFACGWLVQEVGYRPMFLFLEVPVVILGLLLFAQLARRPTTLASG